MFAKNKNKNLQYAVSLCGLIYCSILFLRACSMSPNARMARIASLENMLSISSNSLVAMASQLSEAEERERAFTSRGRWNQLRSMGEAKNLLQYMFNSVADARCFFDPMLSFVMESHPILLTSFFLKWNLFFCLFGLVIYIYIYI